MKPPFEPLSYCITYDQCTPESTVNGEYSESGEDMTCESQNFHQLVDLIKYGFVVWSNSDNTGWLSTHWEIINYVTGLEESRSLHANNKRSRRYLTKAFNYVHGIK